MGDKKRESRTKIIMHIAPLQSGGAFVSFSTLPKRTRLYERTLTNLITSTSMETNTKS